MYTSIRHPEDGRELQIKTGDDSCEWYNVGDEVDWYPCRFVGGVGTLLDGAYPSYSDRGWDDWVIIKDHRVHAVVPHREGSDAVVPHREGTSQASLREEFEIEETDPSLWSVEAWRTRDAIKANSDRFQASIQGLPLEKKFGLLMARDASRRRQMYQAVKDAFVVEPLPLPKKLLCYLHPEEE